LDGPLPKLCPAVALSRQDGRHSAIALLLKAALIRRFLNFQQMRTHYGPWQPCWISNQRQKHKSGRGPSNEHFWQVWLKSVQRFQRRSESFADRKFKMAAMTRLSLTLNPMGISNFHLFF
jgi:hypothetical protein